MIWLVAAATVLYSPSVDDLDTTDCVFVLYEIKESPNLTHILKWTSVVEHAAQSESQKSIRLLLPLE